MNDSTPFVPCNMPSHSTPLVTVPGCVCIVAPPDMLDAALNWSMRGFALVPLHTIRDGACSCGVGDCHSPGKHPRLQHGVSEASADLETVRAWWKRWPDANIGWATGAPSGGLWVVDIDGDEAAEALSALERRNGQLPDTLRIRTGRDEYGVHLVFTGGDELRNTASKVGPKIDTRATGGYAILPPSLHASGRRYSVLKQVDPAAPPAWLVELVTAKRSSTPAAPVPKLEPAPVAVQGSQQVVDLFYGPPGPTLHGVLTSSNDHARLAGIVSAAVRRIEAAPEGARNQTVNSECFAIGGWLEGLGGSIDMVAPALEAAAVVAQQQPAMVRRALAAGTAQPRGRPPDTERDTIRHASAADFEPGGSSGAGPADASAPPAWLERLSSAVESGDVKALYTDTDVLLGLARPGASAGDVERLMADLPGSIANALRRAGRAVLSTQPKAKKLRLPRTLPIVVDCGPSIWVHEPARDRYFVVSRHAAVAEVVRLHGVDCTIQGEKSSRQFNLAELYETYGETASRICWTYGATASVWDQVARTLTIPGAKVRDGEAEYSDEVAGWLEHFVPEDQLPKLLDWLATAAILDRPTSAPQLRGPGGTGKGMLVAALGTWLGGTTSYEHATGEYNASLIEGPLVVLDEGVAEAAPDQFRRITGNLWHAVMAKGRMPERLYGCPRIVVTSNEPDPLQLGKEALSADSEEALGRRVLIFDVQLAAMTYLEELGSWSGTAGWCELDGALVKHLRWLAANRAVVPGRRFLVEGDAAAWVANAHRRAGVGGDIVQAFEAYEEMGLEGRAFLAAPSPFVFTPEAPDAIGMSVSGLQANWQRLVGSSRVPSHRRIAEVLKRLSGQDEPTRPRSGDGADRQRVYLVPKAQILSVE